MAARKRNQDYIDAATKRKREEFDREQAEHTRARDEMRRKVYTAFRLWTVCNDKRCKRAQVCSGDTEACMHERYNVCVPEKTRALLVKAIDLMREGMPALEALAAAKADIAQRLKRAAAFAARRAEPMAAPVPPAPAPIRRSAPLHHGPRIRGWVEGKRSHDRASPLPLWERVASAER